MMFSRIFSFLTWTLVLPALASAASVRTIPIDQQHGAFANTSLKFNGKRVVCYQSVSGARFKSGFQTKVKGKSYWTGIGSWMKTQRLSGTTLSKLTAQSKKAQNFCTNIRTHCAPTVQASSILVQENTPARFALSTTAPCGLPITAVRIQDPLHGSIEATAEGFIYSPDSHSLASDSMLVAAANAASQSAPATITFNLQMLRSQFAGDPNSLLPYREDLTADEVMSVLKKVGLGGSPELWSIRKTSDLADALLNDSETSQATSDYDAYNQSRLNRISNPADPNPRWFYYDVQQVLTNYLRYGRAGRTWMGLVFWSNHMATDVSGWSNSDIHSSMIEHFDIMRNSGLVNFRTLLFNQFHNIPFQDYLNNLSNSIYYPSQNFPREFLELFTAGIKDPITQESNYTEDEVVASTRYLSGWGYNGGAIGYRGNIVNTVPVPQNVRATDNDPYYYPGNASCLYLTANKVVITWDYMVGANRYRLYRAPHGSSSFVQIGPDLYGANQYIDAAGCGLVNPPVAGVMYDYKVLSVASNGATSAFSNVDSGYFATVAGQTAPPLNTTATNGDYSDHVSIQWNSVNGAAGYRVYKVATDGARVDLPLIDLPANQTSYDDYDVFPEAVYMYYVRSIAANGSLSLRNGHGSDEIDIAKGFAYSPPVDLEMVDHFTATEGVQTSGIQLNWAAIPSAAGYRLMRGVNNLPTFRIVTDLSASTTEYLDTTASPGVYYQYLLFPKNADGLLGPGAKGARFTPYSWARSPTNLDPMPFLAWLPANHPNAGGRILGQIKNGVPEGEALSAFGDAYPGQTGIRSFVDHVLNNWPATSRNIGAKLFAQIVHRQINEPLVAEVASDLISNQYNLRPILRKLLVSSAMFSPEANGTCVANPAEVLMSFLRLAELPTHTTSTRNELINALVASGHDISAPPSVFGFPDCGLVRGGTIQDGSRWILSAQTYIAIGNGISSTLNYINYAGSGGEATNLVNYFTPASVTTPDQLVDRTALIFNVKLTSAQRQVLIDYLNKDQNGNASAWRRTYLDRLSGLIRLLVMSVEFLKK